MSIDLEYRTARAAPMPLHRGSLARFIADNNPCYLLSAACMLLGLLTLTNSLSFSPIPHERLIMLIGTLNLYETVLIGLAIWLIARRKIVRDAEILLAIEALFLADGAMLSAEMFSADLTLGLIVNLMLLALTAGKLWIVAMTLRLPIARTLLPLLSLQSLVLGLPALCKWIATAHAGNLSPIALYGIWWMTAIIPAMVTLISRAFVEQPTPNAFAPRRIAMTFAVMAAVSCIVHLALASWVYNVTWFPADAIPLVLGFAFASVIISKPSARIVLPAPTLAILLAINSPGFLTIGRSFPLTPLRLALFGSAIIFTIAFFKDRQVRFAFFALATLLLAAIGLSVDQIIERLTWPWRTMAEGGSELLPRTSAGWGAICVAGAFFFLAAGALISIWKKPPADPDIGEVFSVALRQSDSRYH